MVGPRGFAMRNVLVVVLAAVILIGAIAAPGMAQESEIVTTGVGIAAATPDYANVIVMIGATEKTATESIRKAAATHQELTDCLEAIGVARNDILTQSFSVAENCKREEDGRVKEFIGYTTVHELMIRVRDVEKVGKIVDESMTVKAVVVSRVEFISSKTDSAQKAALAAAVADAQARAEVMAAAAGARLGTLIELVTDDAVHAQGGDLKVDWTRLAFLASSAGVTLSTARHPGDLAQRAIVLGRWQIVKDK
jgi:uncharacterized protein YggE